MPELSPQDTARCQNRLNSGAYYYSFEPTGDASIDLILGAVSLAGKMFHNTEDWRQGLGDWLDAPSVVDLIQQAANDAALERKVPAPERSRRPAGWG